jgi:hypothetical protein
MRFALIPLCASALMAPGCALADAPGEVIVMSSTMQDMAGDIQVMSASLGATNDNLGTTNASLGTTNAGLDGMDQKLGVMVGQMRSLDGGMDGMQASLRETNRLLVEVLGGINATSAGLQGMGVQLETMLGTLGETNAGLARMSGQLDGLGPKVIGDVMPMVQTGVASARAWLVPVIVAIVAAWGTLVVLLWRIHGATQTRRAPVVAEAIFDPAAASR